MGTRQAIPQGAQFAPETRRLERARDAKRHVVEVKRFGGLVIRASLHRFNDYFHTLVGGQHHHNDVGVQVAKLTQHGQAVIIRQLVIQQHEVNAVLGTIDCLSGGTGLDHLVSVGTQAFHQGPSNQRLIVNN